MSKVYTLSLLSFWAFMVSPVFAHTPASHTIQMKKGEFVPAEISILQGDTVVFENLDSVDRWPASNIHPTHEIYSDFDPKRGLKPGEKWSFTFTRSGSWKFHDHLIPALVGSIEVEKDPDFVPVGDDEDDKPAESDKVSFSFWEDLKIFFLKGYYGIFEEKSEEKLKSLDIFKLSTDEDKLGFWLSVFGPDKIMEDLLAESGGGSTIDCHQPAHVMGRITYELLGAETFQRGSANCHSGYYHGAMEAFLKERGTDNLAENINQLCSLFDTGFGKFECLHGVGHGVLAYENYNLLKAIEVCGRLGDQFAISSCHGGMFMENIVAGQGLGATPGHETDWVSDDPHYPCNAIGDDFSTRYQCYQMQTSWMLHLNKYDFDAAAEECLNADADMIPVCFKSLGRDSAGHNLREPNKTMAVCNKIIDDNYHNECMIGAVNVVIDFWGAGLKDQASRFCDVVKDSHRARCYQLLSARLGELFTDRTTLASVCATFSPTYRHLCVSI
jgi:plastocyanin